MTLKKTTKPVSTNKSNLNLMIAITKTRAKIEIVINKTVRPRVAEKNDRLLNIKKHK